MQRPHSIRRGGPLTSNCAGGTHSWARTVVRPQACAPVCPADQRFSRWCLSGCRTDTKHTLRAHLVSVRQPDRRLGAEGWSAGQPGQIAYEVLKGGDWMREN